MLDSTIVEYAFDLIFTLLGLPSTTQSPNTTPFVDCSILYDYQRAYSLSLTLATLLAKRDDARWDLLESRLQEAEQRISAEGTLQLGGMKLLLKSSGVMPGIDNRGDRKGKQKASPEVVFSALELTCS